LSQFIWLDREPDQFPSQFTRNDEFDLLGQPVIPKGLRLNRTFAGTIKFEVHKYVCAQGNPKQPGRLSSREQVGMAVITPPYTQRKTLPAPAGYLPHQLEVKVSPNIVCRVVLSAFQNDSETIGVTPSDRINQEARKPAATPAL
jgi:hypothetical protein